MFDENGYFDPPHDPSFVDSPAQAPTYHGNNNNNNNYNNGLEDNMRLSNFPLEDLSQHHNQPSDEAAAAAAAMGLDHLQHQLGLDLEPELGGHLVQSTPTPMEAATWDPTLQDVQDYQDEQHAVAAQENLQSYVDIASSTFPNPNYAAAPDLLNLLQLPSCAVPPVFPPTASISFTNPGLKPENFSLDVFNELPGAAVADNGSMLYDPSLHLGYSNPQNHNYLKDLFYSLPPNYGLFCGVDEREGMVGGVNGAGIGGANNTFQEMDGQGRQFDSTVLDYRRDMGGLDKGGEVKGNFATEKQRREQLNAKYKALKSLVPNPTKADRASTVGDAIEYIRELRRTVDELTMLVEKKRYGKERRRTLKAEDEAPADMESSSMRPVGDDHEHQLNGALRSSWLQRRSKESFVDVRIIDDEVNIKLTQKKKDNSLFHVAKALDELQLELIHVGGGNIGDHYIFMFNTKISEGSSVYAGAIATKLLEVMDRRCPTLTFPDF